MCVYVCIDVCVYECVSLYVYACLSWVNLIYIYIYIYMCVHRCKRVCTCEKINGKVDNPKQIG